MSPNLMKVIVRDNCSDRNLTDSFLYLAPFHCFVSPFCLGLQRIPMDLVLNLFVTTKNVYLLVVT